MKRLSFFLILLLTLSCNSRKALKTDTTYRVMKTGSLMEMNSEDFLVSNNTWNLETTQHFKFYFDMAISDELQQKTIEAQETNYREIARLMGIENESLEKIIFWLFKDKEQKKLLTQVGSDAHAISTFPAVYYLPFNATGGQEVGHVMTQKYWGFIPKTSNYSLILDEGFNYHIDDERFYRNNLTAGAKSLLEEQQDLSIPKLVTANGGRKVEGVSSGSHQREESILAGAFVKFLIEKYGVKNFEAVWKKAVKEETARPELFETVYGESLSLINNEFEAQVKQ